MEQDSRQETNNSNSQHCVSDEPRVDDIYSRELQLSNQTPRPSSPRRSPFSPSPCRNVACSNLGSAHLSHLPCCGGGPRAWAAGRCRGVPQCGEQTALFGRAELFQSTNQSCPASALFCFCELIQGIEQSGKPSPLHHCAPCTLTIFDTHISHCASFSASPGFEGGRKRSPSPDHRPTTAFTTNHDASRHRFTRLASHSHSLPPSPPTGFGLRTPSRYPQLQHRDLRTRLTLHPTEDEPPSQNRIPSN